MNATNHADRPLVGPKHSTGLARIVTVPEKREYLQAQFLGEEPATVPPALTMELR
ncbi:hypothetical protein [Corynebacterium auriscanis]|uniref:hypothetical protein n=1 Tax=Corynebacterium auriscanis TaxID=99807 RepID=UPI003CEE87DD